MRGVKSPEVPDMRNTRKPSVRLATITVIPTFSCDHLSCFWLGKRFPHDATVADTRLDRMRRPRQQFGFAAGSPLHAHRSMITKTRANAQAAFVRRAGMRSSATRYAAAPQVRVTVSPN